MIEKEEGRRTRRVSALLLIIIFFIVLGIPVLTLTMVYSVNVGEAGLLVDPITQSISEPVLGPSWRIKAPWVTENNLLCNRRI
jgi:hypothetical protein